MKVKIVGIKLVPGNGISLGDLFDELQKRDGDPYELAGYNRYLYVDEIDDYHVGLLITTKDSKKFLEFWHDKHNSKLEARDVSEGAKFADFNFFAINKFSGRGVYQFYYQSCTVNTFGMLCKAHYDELRSGLVKSAQKLTGSPTAKQIKQINQKYQGTLKWEIMVRKEEFNKLISEFKSIRAITLGVSTLAYEDTAFTPLARNAQTLTQKYTFKAGSLVQTIVGGIKKVIKSTDVERAKVEGTGIDNLDHVVKLANTPDYFGEFEFDDIAKDMNISPSKFSESPFLSQLIDIAKKSPAIRG